MDNLAPLSDGPDVPTKQYVDDAVSTRLTPGQADAAYVNVSGDTMTGTLTSPEDRSRAHTVWRTAQPRQNLGDPTVYEAALFESQASNKTWFYGRDQVVYEYTVDGTNWVVHNIDTLTHNRVWAGAAVIDPASFSIPNGCKEYRVTIRNDGNYVFLSDLYMYGSPGPHRVKVALEMKRDGEQWTGISAFSDELSGWPAHFHIPHYNVPWSTANTPGHWNEVRIRFLPRWIMDGGPYETANIVIYAIEWWGGYPSGRRTIYYYDSQRQVAFPSTVYVSGPTEAGHAATKQYVDSAIAAVPPPGISQAGADARYVNASGDTMTGSLGMGSNRIWDLDDPVNADHAATKGYVDGTLQVHSGPSAPTNPNVLLWIDTGA